MLDSSGKAKPLADTPGGRFSMMATAALPGLLIPFFTPELLYQRRRLRVEPPVLDYKRFNRIAD
jgi:hypothetical protein